MYIAELEARVASLEIGIRSAIAAASSTSRQAEVLRACTTQLQALCLDQEETAAELRTEVATINATFDAYKKKTNLKWVPLVQQANFG